MVNNIILRFVSGKDIESLAIRARENFPYSHVEAVTPEGKYLGAHAKGGVAARDPGYDASYLDHDYLLTIPEDRAGQAEEFYAFLRRHIGEPYDFKSILGFIVPGVWEHQNQHIICSALMTLGLRQCEWFKTPLVEGAHKVSPRDLMLVISGRMNVSGE